jgi:hypothetical protein
VPPGLYLGAQLACNQGRRTCESELLEVYNLPTLATARRLPPTSSWTETWGGCRSMCGYACAGLCYVSVGVLGAHDLTRY